MIEKDFHLTAIITSIRHGEKDPKGDLTSEGHLQGARKGVDTHFLQGDILLVHSGVGRVRNTLVSLANHLHLKNPEEIQSISEFAAHYTEYTSHYLQYLYDATKKGTLFATWDSNTHLELHDDRIAKFLSQNDASSEPDIYPSPKEMALRMTKVLLAQIGFATITVPEVRTNFINGTHEPVLMSFLYYYLQDFNPQGNSLDFVRTIGGTVNYSEGFDIYIYQNSRGKEKYIFTFRNKEIELDVESLRRFRSENNR